MKITTLAEAKEITAKYAHHNNIVVSENGTIHANCDDLEAICSDYEAKDEKFFIVNGERVKKTSKTKDTDKTKD